MIKNAFFATVALLLLMAFQPVSAQKMAFVDSEYILQSIPEYADAQAQLDELSQQWQTEIEIMIAEVDKLYKTFRAESVLMPADLKQQKQDEILEKEKAIRDLQKKYFGQEGDLFKKREELVQPIQDKIFTAIETISASRNLGMVFDKAGAVTMMYANVKYDISDDILDELGYSFNTRKNKK